MSGCGSSGTGEGLAPRGEKSELVLYWLVVLFEVFGVVWSCWWCREILMVGCWWLGTVELLLLRCIIFIGMLLSFLC